VRHSPALLLGVLALSACGDRGGPAIDAPLAAKLARQADAVATARQPCAARDHARTLQRQTIAAINAGRIPADYLEPLQARVNEIASELELRCLPTPPRATVVPEPPASTRPAAVRPAAGRHDEGKHRGHEKRDKQGKHGKRGGGHGKHGR
jgi:hypothetical protein